MSNADGPIPEASPPRFGLGFLDRLSDRQMYLLVAAAGLLLYIPLAGTYGLWDPWETHYGEVARQMTKRGDFISLWWPGSPRDQEVFWSKPVLTFWIMSLAMHVAGVGLPGGDPSEMAIGWKAEWALRVPMCLFAVMAILAVYGLVSRFVGRRAGLLSALVLATSPMFSLIARQAMTDIVFVGPMATALCLGAFALYDDDEALPRRGHGWRSWPHHWLFYVTMAVFALIVVPQLVVDSIQLRLRVPWFGGRKLLMYGAVAMIPYYVGTALFVLLAMRSRWKAPLYLYLAAMMCGLAVLAKGFAGLGLPVIIFGVYLFFTWNGKRLRRAQIVPALVISVLVAVLVAAPWHHSMIIRHGWAFWEELFGDNHWRRMVMGRHGDRGSFEYFLRETGYAILPWIALAPAALIQLIGRRTSDARRQGIYWFGAVWFVSAYAVVSLSMTKFHHYILPALPGLAIVIGCFLDELLSRSPVDNRRRSLLLALAGVPILALAFQDLTNSNTAGQRFLWLFSYDYVHSPAGRPWPPELDFRTPLAVFGGLAGLGTLALIFRRGVKLGVGLLAAGAVAFTIFLLDVYMPRVAPFWSQKYPIAAYYQTRRSPDEKLIAYMMYWRGETFYSKNEIFEGPREDRTVFDMTNADQELQAWIQRHRGRRVFFIFERARQARLVSLLPVETRTSFKVIHEKNNKFSVAHADI
jgi:4-amino-4-deoxy-L-arabinose transferase-like glycosyltransferase